MEYILEKEKIQQLAEEVFGKDRVFVKDNISLYIHFPELIVGNSEGHSHRIKDMVIQFRVTHIDEEADFKFFTGFAGTRFTLSLKEVQSGYAFSHLLRNSFGEFNEFCLGTSEFGNLITSLRMEPTEQAWLMLFMALPAYLSWESLEGGPYIQMKDIKYKKTKNESSFTTEALRLLPGIPPDVFSYMSTLELIPNHPLLYDYFNKESHIRRVSGYSPEELKEACENYEEEYEDKSFSFGRREFNIKVEGEEAAVGEQISMEVVEKFIQVIQQKAKQYINQISYEQARNKNLQRIGTFTLS